MKIKTRFACVYYSLFGTKEKDFIDELNKIDAEKYLYKFSLGDTLDLTLYHDVKNYTVEAIPYKIVELYKKIVKLSREN
jgi:adenine-specific DNA-methyltransferase